MEKLVVVALLIMVAVVATLIAVSELQSILPSWISRLKPQKSVEIEIESFNPNQGGRAVVEVRVVSGTVEWSSEDDWLVVVDDERVDVYDVTSPHGMTAEPGDIVTIRLATAFADAYHDIYVSCPGSGSARFGYFPP